MIVIKLSGFATPPKETFLALLDSVIKSKFVRFPSSVCPSLASIISLNLSHGFLSNLICWLNWAIRPDVFWIFQKRVFFIFIFFFNEYLSFSLTWDPMGAKMSKRYTYQLQPKALIFSWNFFSIFLTKVLFFWIFENWCLRFFFVSLTIW